MAALIALAAGVFTAGVATGVIAVVSAAIRREERNFTLTSGPVDTMTRAGRRLTGVYVRIPGGTLAPGRTTARGPAPSS